MASVNKVILIGNLGSDPELRSTQGGKSVATVSLATNEKWTDAAGAKQERVEWHRVVAWDKTADLLAQYVHKGDPLYVEGKLTTRKWQDKDGQDRYTTEVVAQRIQFLGQRRDGGGGGGGGGASGGFEPPPPADDDIPF